MAETELSKGAVSSRGVAMLRSVENATQDSHHLTHLEKTHRVLKV